MRRKTNDISQSDEAPQFALGATSNEAAMAAQVAASPIPDPGALTNQQWQFPRAATDSEISRDMHGID